MARDKLTGSGAPSAVNNCIRFYQQQPAHVPITTIRSSTTAEAQSADCIAINSIAINHTVQSAGYFQTSCSSSSAAQGKSRYLNKESSRPSGQSSLSFPANSRGVPCCCPGITIQISGCGKPNGQPSSAAPGYGQPLGSENKSAPDQRQPSSSRDPCKGRRGEEAPR